MQIDPGPRRAIEHMLRRAQDRLGMEAAFLARLTDTHQVYVATSGEATSFTIETGGSLPLIESYCRHIFESDEPWVIPDTRANDKVAHLEVTRAGDFGSYIGVPVHLPDGAAFGTLCGLSHMTRPDLGERDVAILEALADVLGFHISQLWEDAARIASLEAREDDLTGALRRHELQLGMLSQMVDASRTPTFVLDVDTLRVDYVNQAGADMMGVAPTLLLGHPLPHHVRHWDEAFLAQRLADVRVDDGEVVTYDEQGVADPEQVLEVVAQRVHTGSGDTAILLTAHDVTERRRAEEHLQGALAREREATEELRRLDTTRQAFITAVSHELRTPLTSLRLAAESLQLGRASDDMVPVLLDRLVANAQRLDRLLQDLLDLNQFANGELALAREPTRLDGLVREAVAQVDTGEHELSLDLEDVSCAVARTKYERIVLNLVANAVTHTPPGQITVRLCDTEDGAMLVVEDEGPGVPESDQEAVFRVFHQGDTAPPHRPGTGIGLSLVAAFAELHGGHAWVEPAASGGAAFHVLVPDPVST